MVQQGQWEPPFHQERKRAPRVGPDFCCRALKCAGEGSGKSLLRQSVSKIYVFYEVDLAYDGYALNLLSVTRRCGTPSLVGRAK